MGDLHDELDRLPPRPTSTNLRRDAAPGANATAGDTARTGAASLLDLQRLAGNASVNQLVARSAADEVEQLDAGSGRSPVLDVLQRGGGEPLAPDLRAEMEARLGADFGSVRVHRDAEASKSAESVDAHAYTVGPDVVFRSDRWDPSSTEGKRTLAHELTHVVQQANGPVDGTPTAGGIKVSSPDDAFERAADRSADAALAAPVSALTSAAGSATASVGPSAQLEAAPGDDELEDDELEDEEALQGDFVQREAASDVPGEALDEEDLEEDETLQGDFVQREADEEDLEEEPQPG